MPALSRVGLFPRRDWFEVLRQSRGSSRTSGAHGPPARLDEGSTASRNFGYRPVEWPNSSIHGEPPVLKTPSMHTGLSGLSGRTSANVGGRIGSVLGGPPRLGCGGVDVPRSRSMDWLVAIATMGTLTVCGEQCPLPHSPRGRHSESGLEGAHPESSSACRRLARRIRSSHRVSEDLRRPRAICRNGVSGGGLARSRVYPRICAASAPLRAPWPPEDGVGPSVGLGEPDEFGRRFRSRSLTRRYAADARLQYLELDRSWRTPRTIGLGHRPAPSPGGAA